MVNCTIIFKNGKEISFPTKKFTVKTIEDKIIGLSLEGLQKKISAPLYIDLTEIIAVMESEASSN